MKKLPLLLLLFLALTTAGCHKSTSTNTSSDSFSTLDSKQAFLEQYVTFRRSYEDLHFHISFSDGGSGWVPSPSEWNIRVLAVVPKEEMEEWVHGLKVVDITDTEWLNGLPGALDDLSRFTWYQDEGRTVGLDRMNRRVLYRNITF